jgi:glycosyltransferase involved in cell wall biosynthesis
MMMASPIRVLFILSGLDAGGQERQFYEFLKGFDRSKYVLGVVVFNDNQHYTKQVSQEASYFKILKKRPTRLEPLFYIWKCYKDFKPDIVHTWDSLSSFYSFFPSKLYKVKTIDGSIRDAGVDKGFNKIFKHFFLKRSDLIVTNSFAGLKAYNVTGEVIYNVLNQERFKIKIKSAEFNLVMAANFSDYKDQQTFLKAAVILVQEKTADHIFLLGEGPYKAKYEDWIVKNYPGIQDNFHFPGAVGNVEEYLAKCQVGILCSTLKYCEGLSNSVLEYMAAGLISIVTDIGGSSEIIENGSNGFLIKPGDADRIIKIVRQIRIDSALAEKIKTNARKTITDKFNFMENIRKLENIYQRITKE